MYFLKNLSVNLKKIFTVYGFYICSIFTFLLCFCAPVYYDFFKTEDYSAIRVLTEFDREFMLKDVSLCSYNVAVKGCGSWLSMFVPIISAFAFIPIVCDEYNYGAVRMNIFRTSKLSYHISKFSAGCISGGLAVLFGFLIYTLCVYNLFPDISQYSAEQQTLFEEGLQYSFPKFLDFGYGYLIFIKSAEIFLYGVLSSVPAIMFTSFIRNKYLVICIPFFMKYVMTQTCAKMSFDAWKEWENPNDKLTKLSNILNPDSITNLYLYPEYKYTILIYNFFLLTIAFLIYLIIVRKRFDCGE